MRVLLYLGAPGVVTRGLSLDVTNPAASVFRHAAGTLGYRFFGAVMGAAAITSVVGSAYTSVTFLRTLRPSWIRLTSPLIMGFPRLDGELPAGGPFHLHSDRGRRPQCGGAARRARRDAGCGAARGSDERLPASTRPHDRGEPDRGHHGRAGLLHAGDPAPPALPRPGSYRLTDLCPSIHDARGTRSTKNSATIDTSRSAPTGGGGPATPAT